MAKEACPIGGKKMRTIQYIGLGKKVLVLMGRMEFHPDITSNTNN